MSLTESVPTPQGISIPADVQRTTEFRLSEVFHEALRKVQTVPGETGMIVRCESLPLITGVREELSRLFDCLIQMINAAPAGKMRFLYVDCEEETKLPQQGIKNYTIKFHTNISSDKAWKEANREQLTRCEQIVSGHQGSFSVNDISSTGCLFTVQLKGKPI